ncbi:9391_t:CDS:2, partial [Ambispora leptoticha]
NNQSQQNNNLQQTVLQLNNSQQERYTVAQQFLETTNNQVNIEKQKNQNSRINQSFITKPKENITSTQTNNQQKSDSIQEETNTSTQTIKALQELEQFLTEWKNSPTQKKSLQVIQDQLTLKINETEIVGTSTEEFVNQIPTSFVNNELLFEEFINDQTWDKVLTEDLLDTNQEQSLDHDQNNR